jgi:hypothetical protein
MLEKRIESHSNTQLQFLHIPLIALSPNFRPAQPVARRLRHSVTLHPETFEMRKSLLTLSLAKPRQNAENYLKASN